MHTKKFDIWNALVSSAAVLHTWSLQNALVSSAAVCAHLGLHRKCIGFFGCSLCTFGFCIGNALVSSAAVCAHLGFASEMHWFLRLRSSGTLTMLQKAVASGTLTISRGGKKDLRTVFDLKGDTLFNFNSR